MSSLRREVVSRLAYTPEATGAGLAGGFTVHDADAVSDHHQPGRPSSEPRKQYTAIATPARKKATPSKIWPTVTTR
jgi:hypothetical protein